MTHATIFNALEESQTKAICDRDSLRIRFAKKLFPKIAFYSDYDEMIANESLDLVVVATPTPTHHVVVSSIIKSKPNVSLLVEKPLAVDYQHAKDMVALGKKSRGILSVGYQKRFRGTFRKAKELLQKGAIGEPLFFKGSFFTSGLAKRQKGWRFERGTGGVTRDFGPHLFDLLLWFFGEPTSFRSHSFSVISSDVEDSIHSEVSYHGGLRGTIDVSWVMPEYKSQELKIDVEGTQGSLQVTEDKLILQTKYGHNSYSPPTTHTFYFDELTPPVTFLFSDPEYTLQNKNLLGCIKSRNIPEQTFETAMQVNWFIDKILDSVLPG
jgi:predicted dehydrogenase